MTDCSREQQKLPMIDIVIIGLNCSDSLDRCLQSVYNCSYPGDRLKILYVDGGSSDNSISIAKQLAGVHVIALDADHPTPGRGRNAGWRSGTAPFVQFLDADTELEPDWLRTAAAKFDDDTAAVRGQLQEKAPEQSVYNWIASLEWNSEPGECQAVGGNALVRRRALEETEGFDDNLVSGEEADLSQRMIENNWKILQVSDLMAHHDLNMHTIGQYWRRCFRTGYGYAAVFSRHGTSPRRFWAYEFTRILIRGGGFTACTVLALLAVLSGYASAAAAALLPGLLLLFYPRLFRVNRFMQEKSLSRPQARTYAWHCSFIVVPEFFGIARYITGRLFRRPLRNRRPRNLRAAARTLLISALVAGVGLASTSCRTIEPAEPLPADPQLSDSFTTQTEREETAPFATVQDVKEFSSQVPEQYLVGPGDVLALSVWNHPELSDTDIVVSPDGSISLLRVGIVNVQGRTLKEITDEVTAKLEQYYTNPEVNFSVRTYANNKVFVLGRVSNPGVIHLPGDGTLIEALSLAGGLPVIDTGAFLTRCAIIRGEQNPLWIDLENLLQDGDTGLNARLQNNDIIFIPESVDRLVYVLGAVEKPGPHRLKGKLTFMDALMLSGGPTEEANLKKSFIIRSSGNRAALKVVNLEQILQTGDRSADYLLKDSDIVFVSKTKLAKFNEVVKMISPGLVFLNLSLETLEKFGVMAELRNVLWDQQGFVDSD